MPPTALINTLEGIRRRVKLLGIAYGIGVVCLALAALLVSAVTLDYLLNLPALPRLLVLIGVIGSIGYAMTRFIVGPALARLTIGDVAGRVERTFPEFDDRLNSAIDFIRKDIPGSDLMKDRIISQTVELAGRINLNSVVLTSPAWYSVGGGFGAILMLAILTGLMSPEYRNPAVLRLFNPFTDVKWPKRVQMQMLGDVPTRVPVGRRVDVRMKLTRGDRANQKAIVYYQYDGGPVQQEYLTRAADGIYAASLDARVEGASATVAGGMMTVWMKAGDDEHHLTPITVVPRLEIKSVRASILPPPYVSDRAPVRFDLAAAPAVAGVGSEIALSIDFNRPLANDAKVEMLTTTPDMKVPSLAWLTDGKTGVVGKGVVDLPLRFRVRTTDTDGFQNNGLEEYELIVRPDQVPLVQIEEPRRSEERTAVATVPVQALAEDDYGIDTVKLEVTRLGDKKQWTIPLVAGGASMDGVGWTPVDGTGDRRRYRAQYPWDLAKLDASPLKAGDIIEYQLTATDNYNLNGERHDTAHSGKLRLTIISQDELAARVVDDLRQTKVQIGELKSAQQRNREETASLLKDTEKKPDLDAADRSAAERLTNQQATAASQSRQLAAKLEAIEQKLEENKSPSKDLKDIARDVKNDLNRAAESPMKDAATELTKATTETKPVEKRNATFEAAQKSQSQAIDQLQQAMDRMANIGSLQQTIEQIAALLRDQQAVSNATREAGKDNLGKKPEEMKPEDRDKLEKAAAEQAKLADRTAKALEQMKRTAEQMKKTDPQSADAMSKSAQTAQQQQVTQNQQKAAQQAKQNQQSGAQLAQKQTELGLEMMLRDLKEAERRKLAELQKKLEELQKQIANLIRRQATHNLDDLQLQGPVRLSKVPADELSALNRKAGRAPEDAAPDVKLAGLTASQEQTERNTRDIAKAAEAVPNGAEPAANLTRAAGRMERAIFALREAKPAEAYDPPQVEALAALEAAKKIFDDQKQKTDEQLDEQDREAVRQKYTKIKEDQTKLNDETVRIEKARDETGDLKRTDLVRLGQLPGEQGKLSDRITAIEKDLTTVGSIVYVWANKDIAGSMNEVKVDLAKPATNVLVQSEQARIVEQLDAMIRNLQSNPKQSKFAQDGGGGGGGGGKPKPKLPAEAELRMLKDLQQAINKDTTTQGKLGPKKNNEKLLALGTRQGQIRDLLDQSIQKASGGQTKLGPEPEVEKPSQDEPGASAAEKLENQELDNQMLKGDPTADSDQLKETVVGDRMARSRQRLAISNDPGEVTQLIQKKVLDDLDALIDEARERQAQARNQEGEPGEKQPKPGQNPAQANNQGQSQPQVGGSTPAAKSTAPGAAARNEDLSKQIKESLREWGAITPRLREAQVEGSSETILEQYKRLTEDYYRGLSTKAREGQ